MPHLIVLAGPNGAGKTTASKDLLEGALSVHEFVNADRIAQGLSAFDPESVALTSGRIMLERLRDLARERMNFAFETTLASRSFAPWIKELKKSGYEFHLVYYWLHSPELAVGRVAERVRLGGHHVEAEVIRRRYDGGLRNFFQLYRPIADTWRFFDNSPGAERQLLAFRERGGPVVVLERSAWDQIEAQWSHG